MKKYKFVYQLFIISFVLFLIGCNDQWDGYFDNKNSTNSLMELIDNEPTLSKFAEYIKISGYDKNLSSAVDFSVWAPNNTEIDDIDLNDTAYISTYVGFFITIGNYEGITGQQKLKMMDGKYITIDFDNKTIENASFDKPQVAQNGHLYLLSGKLAPKNNIWELFNQNASTLKQKDYILSLNGYVFDEQNSRPIGVDEETGLTIYDSVKIFTNKLFIEQGDISSEEKEYTYIVLSDNALDQTVALYSSYFIPADTNSLYDLAIYHTCFDLLVEGEIDESQLPANLVSTSGISFTLTSDIITTQVEGSNGILYYVNANPIKEKEKFTDIIIEGEDVALATNLAWKIRDAEGASGGQELYFEGAVATDWVQYNTVIPFPVKIDVYWTAVSDSSYNEQVGIYPLNAGDKTDAIIKFPSSVTLDSYLQKNILGSYTFTEAGEVSFRLIGEGGNPLTLDRLILTPTNQ